MLYAMSLLANGSYLSFTVIILYPSIFVFFKFVSYSQIRTFYKRMPMTNVCDEYTS